MTTARIAIGDDTIVITIDDDVPGGDDSGGGDASAHVIPRGMATVAGDHLVSDPPLPEQLTNAIGDVLDHLDDALREVPALAESTTVVVSGAGPRIIAAVEVGGQPQGDSFVLSRDAAEDVFRTLATESRNDRRRNPGLPADFVDVIVGGCCALVALYRGLHLDSAIIDVRSSG